jgi:hypothetical protein
MPDGGSDCCGICAFNRARATVGSPFDQKTSRERFWAESFCMLREIKITNPFWTYCNNYTRSNEIPDPVATVIDGPAYASGLFEGWYSRIPWHGKLEPVVDVAVTCAICGKQTERGIESRTDGGSQVGFCCNSHYVQWVEVQAAG